MKRRSKTVSAISDAPLRLRHQRHVLSLHVGRESRMRTGAQVVRDERWR
jgi:hypothetical protein